MTIFGYTFRNQDLLDEALTTPSFRNENKKAKDNQRLEFLGDAVLELLSANELFVDNPNANEGLLTDRRAQMVSTASLCAVAARHNIASLLKRNHSVTQISKNSKTLADAIEAILGAAWLDGGLSAAKQIYDALELNRFHQENPKGELQSLSQAMKPPRQPLYETLKVLGPPHEPVFTVRVFVEDLGEAEAQGSSRKDAEAAAAANLLKRLTEQEAQ